MDPESATFTPRDDLWRVQNEMLRVHQVQAELADRVSRLERRHDEDTKLKSLWGTASPFPSALASTPQQGLSSLVGRTIADSSSPSAAAHVRAFLQL